MITDHSSQDGDVEKREGATRWCLMKMVCVSLGLLMLGGCGSDGGKTEVTGYPIYSTVAKTTERMITFPYVQPSTTPARGTMPDPVNEPEKGFWQIETSSLRDFPQQFRTFEIFLNSDYTVSIEAVNVDPAFAEGTPAAKSRKNAIAAQQIVHTNLTLNSYNFATFRGNPIAPTDPTRPQSGEIADEGVGAETDPSIKYVDLTSQGIPYNASYNARLFKQLSPTMQAHL